MEKLVVLVGTLIGNQVSTKLTPTKLLKVISGQEDAPAGVVKAADIVSRMLADPERRSLVQNSLEAIMRSEGMETPDVVSLVSKAAPFIGAKSPETLDDILGLALEIANRIKDKPNSYVTRALITCPSCNFTHTVGS